MLLPSMPIPIDAMSLYLITNKTIQGNRYNGSDDPGHVGNLPVPQPTDKSIDLQVDLLLSVALSDLPSHFQFLEDRLAPQDLHAEVWRFFETRRLETLPANQKLKFCETAIEKLVPPERRLTVCSKKLRPFGPPLPRHPRKPIV